MPEERFLIKLQADACNFIKKESLAQVFSYEFCQFFKKSVAASDVGKKHLLLLS